MKLHVLSNLLLLLSGICIGVTFGIFIAQLPASPWVGLGAGVIMSWSLISFGEWRERRKWEDRTEKLVAISELLSEKLGIAHEPKGSDSKH